MSGAFCVNVLAADQAALCWNFSKSSIPDPFEGVDWTPFDFISVDLYRSIEVAGRFRDGVRALVALSGARDTAWTATLLQPNHSC